MTDTKSNTMQEQHIANPGNCFCRLLKNRYLIFNAAVFYYPINDWLWSKIWSRRVRAATEPRLRKRIAIRNGSILLPGNLLTKFSLCMLSC